MGRRSTQLPVLHGQLVDGTYEVVDVGAQRVFLLYGGSLETSAFLDVMNLGGADDWLVGVTTPTARGGAELTRHRMTGSASATRGSVASVAVRAGGELYMSPQALDLIVRPKAGWRAGDLVSFTLYFEHSEPIRTIAVVIRPGGGVS